VLYTSFVIAVSPMHGVIFYFINIFSIMYLVYLVDKLEMTFRNNTLHHFKQHSSSDNNQHGRIETVDYNT